MDRHSILHQFLLCQLCIRASWTYGQTLYPTSVFVVSALYQSQLSLWTDTLSYISFCCVSFVLELAGPMDRHSILHQFLLCQLCIRASWTYGQTLYPTSVFVVSALYQSQLDLWTDTLSYISFCCVSFVLELAGPMDRHSILHQFLLCQLCIRASWTYGQTLYPTSVFVVSALYQSQLDLWTDTLSYISFCCVSFVLELAKSMDRHSILHQFLLCQLCIRAKSMDRHSILHQFLLCQLCIRASYYGQTLYPTSVFVVSALYQSQLSLWTDTLSYISFCCVSFVLELAKSMDRHSILHQFLLCQLCIRASWTYGQTLYPTSVFVVSALYQSQLDLWTDTLSYISFCCVSFVLELAKSMDRHSILHQFLLCQLCIRAS